MINLTTCKISYHFQNDRQERKAKIDKIINNNLGQVVIEEWYRDAWRCLTDTGLIIIVSAKQDFILTYYFATMKKAKAMYHDAFKTMPQAVANKIIKNANTYSAIYHASISERDHD
jgi:hypothetical protein